MVTDSIVIGSSKRAQLLSIQRTQNVLDTTQLRLATGKKVNSALDNPQNFFASETLGDRASDLRRLLDNIGQSIQTIKAADAGVQALTRLIEQTEAIAQEARDTIANQEINARFVGSKSRMWDIDNLVDSPFINDGDSFEVVTGDGEGGQLRALMTINNNMSMDEFIVAFNDLTDAGGERLTAEARLDRKGRLVIESTVHDYFRIESSTIGTATYNTMSGLGLEKMVDDLGDGTVVAELGLTSSSLVYTSVANNLYPQAAEGEYAAASTTMYRPIVDGNPLPLPGPLQTENGDAFMRLSASGPALSAYEITVNDTLVRYSFASSNGGTPRIITIQEFVDRINTQAEFAGLVEAEYIAETGQIKINAISSDVKSISFGIDETSIVQTAGGVGFPIGFGSGAADAIARDIPEGIAGDGVEDTFEKITLGRADDRLEFLEEEFENVLYQIDQAVTDSGYRGTNILRGDDLTTFFNESRSSKLVIEGQNFTHKALGFDDPDFRSADSIDEMLEKVRNALESVRTFGTTLANDLSLIQNREEHAQDMINTLTEGSDILTLADQNEEGTKMLTLQTRQQIQMSVLSFSGANIADTLFR